MKQNLNHESICRFWTNNFGPFLCNGMGQHVVLSAGDKTVQSDAQHGTFENLALKCYKSIVCYAPFLK